jgi:hypothetical protein
MLVNNQLGSVLKENVISNSQYTIVIVVEVGIYVEGEIKGE